MSVRACRRSGTSTDSSASWSSSLLLVALLALAAVDAGADPACTAWTGDLAGDAGERGSRGVRGLARRARGQARRPRDDRGLEDRARLRRIEVRRGDVTVEVSARADTIVVDWILFLDDLATVTVTRTSPAP